jgi:hypothetical protein
VVGNTSLRPHDPAAGLKQKILRKLGKIAETPFFNQPNDIAVLVESITAVPAGRSPAPKQFPTVCNHLEYFVHPAGLASLSAAVVGTGIKSTERMTGQTQPAINRDINESSESSESGGVEPEAAEPTEKANLSEQSPAVNATSASRDRKP